MKLFWLVRSVSIRSDAMRSGVTRNGAGIISHST